MAYTKSADRVPPANEATGKLSRNKAGQSIPNLVSRLGVDAKKFFGINAATMMWCGQEDSNLHPG
jgi:hypothetical protein